MAATSIARISAARKALAEARSLPEVLDIMTKAGALKGYLKSIGERLEIQNEAAYLKLRAERIVGAALADMEKNEGGRPSKNGTKKTPDIVSAVSLDDLGITHKQSSRWQKEAKLPEDEFELLVKECETEEKELTQSLVLARVGAGHVSQSTGENEWYTPVQFTESARRVMGFIDLDPASSDEANELVQAESYYTIADDGLSKEWAGTVWMNPPYSRDLIEAFCRKLVECIESQSVPQAVVLVNNATETAATQMLLSRCAAVCFPCGRIKFHGKNGKNNSPLQGQVIIYFGTRHRAFISEFKKYGVCLKGVK